MRPLQAGEAMRAHGLLTAALTQKATATHVEAILAGTDLASVASPTAASHRSATTIARRTATTLLLTAATGFIVTVLFGGMFGAAHADSGTEKPAASATAVPNETAASESPQVVLVAVPVPQSAAPQTTATKAPAPKAPAPKAEATTKAATPKTTASKTTAPKAIAPKTTASKTAAPKASAPKAPVAKSAPVPAPKAEKSPAPAQDKPSVVKETEEHAHASDARYKFIKKSTWHHGEKICKIAKDACTVGKDDHKDSDKDSDKDSARKDAKKDSGKDAKREKGVEDKPAKDAAVEHAFACKQHGEAAMGYVHKSPSACWKHGFKPADHSAHKHSSDWWKKHFKPAKHSADKHPGDWWKRHFKAAEHSSDKHLGGWWKQHFKPADHSAHKHPGGWWKQHRDVVKKIRYIVQERVVCKPKVITVKVKATPVKAKPVKGKAAAYKVVHYKAGHYKAAKHKTVKYKTVKRTICNCTIVRQVRPILIDVIRWGRPDCHSRVGLRHVGLRHVGLRHFDRSRHHDHDRDHLVCKDPGKKLPVPCAAFPGAPEKCGVPVPLPRPVHQPGWKHGHHPAKHVELDQAKVIAG